MSPVDPKAKSERMRDALDLIVNNLEDDIGRVRARVCSLVDSVHADAQGLVEREKHDGVDAVDPTFVAMHVRELVAAKAELLEKRERLREMNSVIDFAERAAHNKKSRS
jgi:hypothetical protein